MSVKEFLPKVRKILSCLLKYLCVHVCVHVCVCVCVCVLWGMIPTSGFIYVAYKIYTNYPYLFIGVCHAYPCYILRAHVWFWGFYSFIFIDLFIFLNSYSFILNFDNFVSHVQYSTFFFFSFLAIFTVVYILELAWQDPWKLLLISCWTLIDSTTVLKELTFWGH